MLSSVTISAALLAAVPAAAGPRGAQSVPSTLFEHDVAIESIIIPPNLVREGTVVHPSLRLANLGQHRETVYVMFTIDDLTDAIVYAQLQTISLDPGERGVVTYVFPWTAEPVGRYLSRAWHSLAADENRANDTIQGYFSVLDLQNWLQLEIVAPRDTVDTSQVVVPEVFVHNATVDTVRLDVCFEVRDSGAVVVYSQVEPGLVFVPDRMLTLWFPKVRFTVPGPYTAVCSLCVEGLVPDTAVYERFRVRAGPPGIGEGDRGTVTAAGRALPTLVRDILVVKEIASTGRRCPMSLFDAAGRKVMTVRPGRNDVGHVAPGVYFLGVEGSAIWRLVIGR